MHASTKTANREPLEQEANHSKTLPKDFTSTNQPLRTNSINDCYMSDLTLPETDYEIHGPNSLVLPPPIDFAPLESFLDDNYDLSVQKNQLIHDKEIFKNFDANLEKYILPPPPIDEDDFPYKPDPPISQTNIHQSRESFQHQQRRSSFESTLPIMRQSDALNIPLRLNISIQQEPFYNPQLPQHLPRSFSVDTPESPLKPHQNIQHNKSLSYDSSLHGYQLTPDNFSAPKLPHLGSNSGRIVENDQDIYVSSPQLLSTKSAEHDLYNSTTPFVNSNLDYGNANPVLLQTSTPPPLPTTKPPLLPKTKLPPLPKSRPPPVPMKPKSKMSKSYNDLVDIAEETNNFLLPSNNEIDTNVTNLHAKQLRNDSFKRHSVAVLREKVKLFHIIILICAVSINYFHSLLYYYLFSLV